MKNNSWQLRRLCVIAMLCAMAFAAVAFIRIPVVLFLKYEPKDVILTIGGFLFGPWTGAAMAVAVALLEMVTVSDTGVIGLLMNALSSCLFVCTAAIIYHSKKTLSRAIIGLLCGAIIATGGMLLWNYLITPLYMAVSRQDIAGMLVPVFLPFNLLKNGLNATLTMLLYKSVSSALRAAHLLPKNPNNPQNAKRQWVWIAPLFLLATLVLVMLAWKGII